MKRRYGLTFLLASVLMTHVSVSLNAQPDPQYPQDPTLTDYLGLTSTLLAEDVRQIYTSDGWTDSVMFAFDFVSYSAANKEIVRYHNEWNLLTDEALLSGKLDDGRPYEVNFTDFSQRQGTMMVDSQAVPEIHLQGGLRTAYDRLKNNFLWLLTPMRLLDSEVTLEVMSDSVIDGNKLTPLKVHFNDSNSSAKYALLYINTNYKNIDRWRVNYNGVEQEYIWRSTRRVGPYLFSTRMWAKDFSTYIQLEKIKVKDLRKGKIAETNQK